VRCTELMYCRVCTCTASSVGPWCVLVVVRVAGACFAPGVPVEPCAVGVAALGAKRERPVPGATPYGICSVVLWARPRGLVYWALAHAAWGGPWPVLARRLSTAFVLPLGVWSSLGVGRCVRLKNGDGASIITAVTC
jgi:hypothetical protein